MTTEEGASTRIPEILRNLEAAMVNGSEAADAFEIYTAPEYVFTSPAGALRGRAEVLDGLRSGEVRFSSYGMHEIDVRPYGQIAIVLGRAGGEGTNPDGEVFHGAYRFTSVWRVVDSDWRLVAWHATAVANEAEDRR